MEVADIKEGHPHYESEFKGPLPYPVGFLDKGMAYLMNNDLIFPEDYHSRLREIYKSV